AGRGKDILFVGTKKQAQEIIKTEAERCGMPFVADRWLGGMMTNFQTMRKSIRRMETLQRQEQDGTFQQLKKKERLMRRRETEKLDRVLGGIAQMGRLPGAIFIVDIRREHIAVDEARKLGIPVIAMVDTNVDPDLVDFPIPANDDAMKSIQLATRTIADAVMEGRKASELKRAEESAEAEKRAQDAAEQEEATAEA
ncbi:MAG: 30S ribosomal protein S2, partial [Bacteroidota bacterium]